MEKTISKQTENLSKFISKHKLFFAGFSLGILVLFFAVSAGLGGLSLTNVYNPGFEGAKVACYGVNFLSGYQSGLNTVYQIGSQNLGINYPLVWSGSQSSPSSLAYWGAGTSPSQQILVNNKNPTNVPIAPKGENQLATVVESNIQLQGLTATGAPVTGDNSSSAQYIQTWHLSSSTNNGVTTYNITKEDVLLSQADFHIDIYIPSSQANAGTGSGWQEGTWTNLQLWYEIYWYDWLNSLGNSAAMTIDPTVQQNLAALNMAGVSGANDSNLRSNQFSLRGGYPIAAWVQQATMPIQTASGIVQDLLNVTSVNSKSGQIVYLAGSQVSASTLAGITGNVQLSPAKQGNYIDLFTQPSDQYQLPTAQVSTSDLQNAASSHALDAQTQVPNEFFKIGINSFGTYVSGDWWNGYTVYYPAVAYTLHAVFAVYGTHTYLWTTQTAAQNNYSGWTDHTTTAVVTSGVGTGIANFLNGIGNWFSNLLSNPFTDLILLFIIAGVGLVVMVVFFPEVLRALSRSTAGKIDRKGKKG